MGTNDGALGMANLGPDTTGIGAYIHVFQNADRRARHAPRVKVFPGKPHEGRATVIAVPTFPTERARVVGKTTVRGKKLKLALEFVNRNWRALALYWSFSGYTTEALLMELRQVKP